ncbi:MAG: NADH-quinone oxidoreductase subunit N [Chlorobiota bacterium]
MSSEFILLLPLIIVGAMSVISILVDVLNPSSKSSGYYLSIITILLTGGFAVNNYYLNIGGVELIKEETITYGMLSFSGFSAFFDILFCLGALLIVLNARNYLDSVKTELNEFYNLVLYALAGMMVIAHSNHLLTLFIGIELMSVTFYIMSGYFRFTKRSVEAALKYFLLGAFSTGFLVYGMAMLYGSTGSMFFPEIAASISNGTANSAYLMFGAALMIMGLSFKASAFPFHQWAPDVYTGAPTVVVSFMSTAGKAAALAGFIIIAKTIVPVGFDPSGLESAIDSDKILIAIAAISALTMLVGNITALVQKSVKRMLAYSSVAHAGYMLMGIVANTEAGWSALMFYAVVYTFMQIGAFIIVGMLERDTNKNLNFDDYSGLSKRQPALAAIMAFFMFSLAGIPPMAGFFGKYYLFMSVISEGYVWLAIVAVVSSIISVAFYIGLVVNMYFKDSEDTLGESLPMNNSKILVFVTSAIVLIIGLNPGGMLSFISSAL